jgi:phosphate transport system substrate-binding protein
MRTYNSWLSSAALVTVALFGAGCGPTGSTPPTSTGSGTGAGSISGPVSIDGSSTVAPLSSALAEEFMQVERETRVTVGTSGTGGGFKKFGAGEIDITGASRPIEQSEIDLCAKNGVEFVELPIAFDGISVVTNRANDLFDSLTIDQLKRIWEPNSKVQTWRDLNPAWPAQKVKLYGAGTDSGTFDYFTKAVVGTEKASRTDYQGSEDDNILVQGIKGDRYSLGYFGYSYYEENKNDLKLVGIDAGDGPKIPSPETIADGTYSPLSRPLFFYVNKKSLQDKPAVAAFIKFITEKGAEYMPSAGFVALPTEAYALIQKRADEGKTGTVFKGAEIGLKITDVLARE